MSSQAAPLLLFIFLALPASSGADAAGRDVVLPAGEVVENGEILEIEPGSRVVIEGSLELKGTLRIEGTEVSPVTIEMKNEKGYGVVIRGGALEAKYFSISGAGRGIESYSGKVSMARGKVRLPGIHLSAAGGTDLDLRETEFVGGKAGVVIRSGSKGIVISCRFAGQEKAGVYVYGTAGVRITGALFTGAGTGVILTLPGADPRIEGSRFEGNGEGIRVEKLAGPVIVENSFHRNRYGLFFTKKGAGEVTGNVFDDNDVSVYVKYSSYPRTRGNSFLAFRRYAVELESQSSAWEESASEKDREEPVGAPSGPGSKSYGPYAPDMKNRKNSGVALTGKVDFRENFWGPLTPEMEEKGPRGNITGIHDGRDVELFLYEGREYPMDTVDFSGYLARPTGGFDK